MTTLPFKLRHQQFGRNERGRDLVVGDIHGHFGVLEQALEIIHFEPDEDRLFALGDLVDRGNRSAECADWLAKPWFYSILGNHEVSHLLLGDGIPTARYFADLMVIGEDHWVDEMPPDQYQQFLESLAKLPVAITLESTKGPVGLIHAGMPQQFTSWKVLVTAIEFGYFTTGDLRTATWSRDFDLRPSDQRDDDIFNVLDVCALIHGHDVPRHFEPLRIGNRYYIETGTYLRPSLRTGGMTIVDIENLDRPLISSYYPD